MLKLKVTTRALKCIKKVCVLRYAMAEQTWVVTRLVQAGGLDNYVMKTNSNLLGMEGMRLRILVRSRLEEEARLKEEAHKIKQAEEKGQKLQATVSIPNI